MKVRHRLSLALVIVAVLLVALRLALAPVGTWYLNVKLADLGDYRGHLEDIDVALWRGAYVIKDLKIEKMTGKVPVPFLVAPRIDVSLSWSALFKGAVVGEVIFIEPQLNFVDGGQASASQAGTGVDWRDALQKLLPVDFNQVVIRNGSLHFRNFSSKPKVDLYLTNLNAKAVNLTNADRRQGQRVADVEASATVLDSAPLELRSSFDPLGEMTDFGLQFKVSDFSLPKANDFARAYGGIDFEAGKGSAVMELEAHDKQLSGYFKPLFTDASVLSWKGDVERDHDNPLRLIWEGLATVLSEIFTNHSQDQIATRIPITGTLDDRQLGTLPAIGGILRNAFVQALKPSYDGIGEKAPADAKGAGEDSAK